MAKVVKIENRPYLEIDLTDCEALVPILQKEVSHLRNRVQMDDVCIQDHMYNDKQRSQAAKRLEAYHTYNNLLDAVIQLGNNL